MVRAASLVLVLLLGACSVVGASPSAAPRVEPSEARLPEPGPASSASAVARWAEPVAYSFTLESRCGERNLIGRFAVEVENGVVVAVEGLDHQGETAIAVVQPADVPTLAGLHTLVAEARADGADKVDLVTDPADGHPVSVEIDWEAAAIDDEECYTVSDLVASQ